MKADTDYRKVLGDNLIRIMENRGLSQADMARACHTTRQSFNKILNGHSRLDAEKVFHFQLNGIGPGEIFHDEEYEKKKVKEKYGAPDEYLFDYILKDLETYTDRNKKESKKRKIERLMYIISVCNDLIRKLNE